MKLYRRKIMMSSDSSQSQYIGGKLYDLPEDYWEDEKAQESRAEEQNKYIYDFADNYIIYWNNGETISLTVDLDISWDIIEKMAIKDGVDVIAYPDHIDVVGYYGGRQDVAHLYPISDAKAQELVDIIDNSEYDETTTLQIEISQYAWNGASEIDIIKSWS